MAKRPRVGDAALALTFDDVLLRPGHSTVMPTEVDVATRLTREIAEKFAALARRHGLRLGLHTAPQNFSVLVLHLAQHFGRIALRRLPIGAAQ